MLLPLSSKKQDDLMSQGCFPIVGEISFDKMEKFAGWIADKSNQSNNLTVLIASSGGEPSAVLWLSSYLRTLPNRMNLCGVAVGECGSAAFTLLQLCQWRAAVRGTGLFVHRMGYKTRIGNHERYDLTHVVQYLERLQQLEDELVLLQCRRIGCSVAEWYQFANLGEMKDNRVIFVDEARRLNFIDRILVRFPL